MKRSIIIIVFLIMVLPVGYIIFTPSDGLPASIKISKMRYIISSILSEVLNLEQDTFKEENLEFGNTYRLLHVDSWVESGLRYDDIKTALANMQSSEKDRFRVEYDTVIEYGPGNWVYEFEQFGDSYLQEAKTYELTGEKQKAQELYIRASMYYKVATFPGIFRKWNPTYRESIEAYKKCLAAYEKYGQYLTSPLEKVTVDVDNENVFGYLHLPYEVKNKKIPLVMLTNGTDFFMTELYQFTEKLLAKGFGVFVFDLPGIGASHKITLKPGVEGTKLHKAFLSKLSKDSRLDINKIGLIGKSMGGNLASRLGFTELPVSLKFIVNICGPVDGVSQVPLDVLKENFPEMTFDALLARFSDKKTKNENDIANGLKGIGLIASGMIKEGTTTDIPILSINTCSDPANPVWEMKLLTKISRGGRMIITDGEGHCPENFQHDIVFDWIMEKL